MRYWRSFSPTSTMRWPLISSKAITPVPVFSWYYFHKDYSLLISRTQHPKCSFGFMQTDEMITNLPFHVSTDANSYRASDPWGNLNQRQDMMNWCFMCQLHVTWRVTLEDHSIRIWQYLPTTQKLNTKLLKEDNVNDILVQVLCSDYLLKVHGITSHNIGLHS